MLPSQDRVYTTLILRHLNTSRKGSPPRLTSPITLPAILQILRDSFAHSEPWNSLPASLPMLQEGGPLPGPETGLLSNTRKWIVRGDTCADKARDFIGKGTRAESRRLREPRRTALPRGSHSWVLWWWNWFPGGLWPIILIQSLSWWRTHGSAKMDASERDSGKWTDTRCLLLTVPKLFRLVVAY